MKSGWSCICCLYLGPLVMPTPLLRQKLLRWNEPVHGHSLVLDALNIQRSGSISALWYIIEVCTHPPGSWTTNSTHPPSDREMISLGIRNIRTCQSLSESVSLLFIAADCSWLQLHVCQDTEMSLLCPADHKQLLPRGIVASFEEVALAVFGFLRFVMWKMPSAINNKINKINKAVAVVDLFALYFTFSIL